MSRNQKKYLSLLLIVFVFVSSISFIKIDSQAAVIPDINYRAHIQDVGWMDYVKNGNTAGSIGNGKRMEALQIDLVSGKKSMVKYRVHIQDAGWLNWVNSGGMAGTTNEAKRIEAVQIKLAGTYAKKYDIYYRAHISQAGWMGWTKNGTTAGSEGYSMQLEAVQIKLVQKGQTINDTTLPAAKMPSVTYKGHVSDIGWQKPVSAGKTAGTTNQARRLEAFTLDIKNFHGESSVHYMAHVAEEGWQNWVNAGGIAGTTGKGHAIEAVKIELIGYLSRFYDIYYRLHVKDYGWLGWARNGEIAGTTGGGTRAEAIQIKLVIKNSVFDRNGVPYIDQTPKGITADQAIAWVKSLNGRAIDGDHNGDIQCVDLIVAYYEYLGVNSSSGDGSEYTRNWKPDNWQRLQGVQPQKGDILVFTGGFNNYGHVAIYESEGITCHQNFSYHKYVEPITYNYRGFRSEVDGKIYPTPYWGVIRPNFQ